nr:F0F1 ATP synthase subunit beta [Blastocatellia bacterium]
MANEQNGQVGTVVQIIGPVVDVEFSSYLPPIHQALRITSEGFAGETIDVVAEVQQHLGEGRV